MSGFAAGAGRRAVGGHWIGLVAGFVISLCGVARGLAQGFFDLAPAVADRPIEVTAQFSQPADGQPARLFVTVTMKPGWHIYSLTQTGRRGPRATAISLDEASGASLLGPFHPDRQPDRKTEPLFDNLLVEEHHGSVTFFAPIDLPASADARSLRITGRLRAQPCDANSCLPPQDFPFAAVLGPGVAIDESRAGLPAPTAGPEAVSPPGGPSVPSGAPAQAEPIGSAPGPSAADPAEGDSTSLPWRPYTSFEAFRALLAPSFDPEQLRANVARGFEGSNLPWIIVLGFLGGIILNLMPCVLPVIGLKVLAFVQQSGEDRRRALLLNLWYSAGLLSVFLLLAALAVTLNLGWGGLFTFAAFNIFLAAIVFAMGLSFLGVWEIPIPGFVGSGKAVELASREGLSGAFAKGVVTTILATPCTGPFMGTALAWAVNQPPSHTFAVFTSVGLGMASPYLLIGAFPSLVRFLPKPGAWMETFKQIMGFVLLGTVVYIFTFLQSSYVVPTVGLLFAIWGACWWIGRQMARAATAPARTWLEAAAWLAVAWLVLFPGLDARVAGPLAFRGLHRVMDGRHRELIERESALALEKLRAEGYALVKTDSPGAAPAGPNTVLVDFTADWCLTCKTFEAQVLNTPEVRRLVVENAVVALKADWTHQPPEVTRLMDLLGARQVPVVAIFPADDPNRPTAVFRGAYTQQQVLDALRRAGPSKRAGPAPGATAAAEPPSAAAERR